MNPGNFETKQIPFVNTRSSNRNIVQLYYEAATNYTDQLAFVFNAPHFDKSWTWGEVWHLATRQAQYFMDLGLSAGDRVVIQSTSDWTWELCQLSLFMVGVTVVGLDPKESQKNYLSIYQKTEFKCVLTQIEEVQEKWTLFLTQNKNVSFKVLPLLNWQILHQGAMGHQKRDFSWIKPAPAPQSEALIVFTSGTTSEPKGIVYSHRKVIFAVQSLIRTFPEFDENSTSVSWLPLSNLFQKMVNLRSVTLGVPIYFVTQPSEVFSLLPKIKPDIFISVPRFYEKIYEAFESKLNTLPKMVQVFIQLGQKISYQYWNEIYKKQNADHPTSSFHQNNSNFKFEVLSQINRKLKIYFLKILLQPWDSLVFSGFRKLFGGRIRYMISGSAPLRKDLLEKYYSLGLPIFEAYGTSENIVPLSANTLSTHRLGSVGKPLQENSIRISEEGEILVSGDGVFSGYINDQQLPFIDGYYHTGDLGYFDKNGFLYIHGRKSEVFKTTTGKKVAVAEIENHFNQNKLIDQVVVVGADRKSPLMLMTLDYNGVAKVLNKKVEDIFDKKIFNLIENEIRKSWYNLELGVKPIGTLIIPRKLTYENDELTLNLKIKRKTIEKKFQKEFDRLQIMAEKNFDFPILYIENLSKTENLLISKPKTILSRFLLLGLSFIKAKIAQVGYQLGFFTKSQYHRKIGQFLRITFGQLGGPLQKLAQMISHLAGEIPEEIREELGQLLHDATPVDSQLIRAIIESELQKPIEVLFKEFRNDPISTGSIGQVHWAKLHNGEEVVVKVLLPHIDKILKSDMKVLKAATPFIKRLIHFESMSYHIEELGELFKQEIDFRNEAKNYKFFKYIHKSNSQLIVPRVFDEYSTSKILVTEFFQAISLDEFNYHANEEDKKSIAEVIWTTASVSINLFACFNADPHSGNFLIQNNKVILIDFGFCKYWNKEFIEIWKKQIIAGCRGQILEFEKYSRELGIVHRTNPNFYKELLQTYQTVIYEPWLHDKEHEFNSEWLKKYLDAIFKSNISVPDLELPKDFLALSRLYWGMFGIMANMNAKTNFYKLTIPYVEAPLEKIEENINENIKENINEINLKKSAV